MRYEVLFAALIIAVVGAVATAEVFDCGYDPENRTDSYDYGESVRARFIFVDFDDPDSCLSQPQNPPA